MLRQNSRNFGSWNIFSVILVLQQIYRQIYWEAGGHGKSLGFFFRGEELLLLFVLQENLQFLLSTYESIGVLEEEVQWISGGTRIAPEFFLVSKLWREGVNKRERGALGLGPILDAVLALSCITCFSVF
jgi:hypothetical protein